jgi:ABC-type Fe3+-hydroxamate transport system substrate-binding protein
MYDNQIDNQRFIDAARERGEDTFMYIDPKSGECLLVSGSAASIRLLGEIVDDYEMVCEVVEGVVEEMDKLKENGHAD